MKSLDGGTHDDRRFTAGVIALGVFGLVAAFVADSPLWGDGWSFADATREIGGALVAGAVLAVIVVHFEQRRENVREQLADQREQLAARRAWRRDLDLQLFKMVNNELMEARQRWLEYCEDEFGPKPTSNVDWALRGIKAQDVGQRQASINDVVADVDTLLRVLRDVEMRTAWTRWDAASSALQGAVDADTISQEQIDSVQGAEADAWMLFVDNVERYMHREYPVD